jgi:hypothetical protein
MRKQHPSLRGWETLLESTAEQLRIAAPSLEVGELLPQQHVVRIRRRSGQLAVVGEELG